MKPSQIVALFVRLFSIGLLIFAVRILAPEIFGLLTFEYYEANIFLAFVVAFVFFVAVFLWKFPLFIASKLLSFGPDEQQSTNLSESSALRIGLILLGVYLFYWAVSDSFFWAYMLMGQREILGHPLELGTQEQAMIFSTIVELVFSVFLLVGSKRIAKFLSGLRKAGLE